MRITPTTRRLAAIAAGTVLGGLALQAAASEAPVPEIDWQTGIGHFQFDNDKFIGQRLSVACPPLSVRTSTEGAYGTDVYPSKTPVCIAALHAGAIDAEGGIVTVQLNPGAKEYAGSLRNGVTTASLPATPRSIAFVGGTAGVANARVFDDYLPRLDWDTKFTSTGFANRRLVGQMFSFRCPAAPADMRPRRIVGTDAYAFHSMVCRAAVHAGQITTDGGVVTVRMEPGRKKLVGSIRNGIESSDGAGGHTTLAFVAGQEGGG